MPIPVMCSRGHVLLAKDKDAGKTILCPRCDAAIQVPSGHAEPSAPAPEASGSADVRLGDTSDPRKVQQPGPHEVKLACANGHLLFVRDHLVGQYVACPRCHSLQLVPEAQVAARVGEGPATTAAVKEVPLGDEGMMVELIEDGAGALRLLPEAGQIGLVCLFGHQLFVPEDKAGQQVNCPVCASPVEVPTLKTTAPVVPTLEISPPNESDLVEAEVVEVDEVEVVEDRKSLPATGIVNQPGRVHHQPAPTPAPTPRPRKKKRHPPGLVRPKRVQGLDKVNIGLGFHYARVALMLLGILFLIAANGLVPFALSGRFIGGIITVLGFLAVLSYFIAPFLGITGSVLCLWTPEESGARWMVLVSLCIDAFGLPIGLVFQFLSFGGAAPDIVRVLAALPIFLAGVTSWVFFMLYLRQIAVYVEEEVMAEEATSIMFRGLVLAVIALVSMFLLALFFYLFICLGLFYLFILGVCGMFVGLKFLGRQLALIGSIRQVIFSKWSPA